MKSFVQILKTQPLLVLGLTGIYFLSAILLANNLIGWDISNGLMEADKLVRGGTYGQDFFEPSPPMFLWLYAIPVLISQWLSLKITLVFPLFVLVLAGITLSSCYPFIYQIFNKESVAIKNFMLVILAAILLLIPIASDLGQREHLLIIFILPYIFLMAERFESKPHSQRLLIFIGVWASIGFSIKPYFIIDFVILEFLYAWRISTLWGWLRTESILILFGVSLVYGLAFALYPGYFNEVIPHTIPLYYSSYGQDYKILLHSNFLIFCLFVLIIYCCFYKSLACKPSLMVLQACIIGFLISYLLQRTSWFYHIYPAYSLAVLSLAMMSMFLLNDKDFEINKLNLFALFFCFDFFMLLKVYSLQLFPYLIGTVFILGLILFVFLRRWSWVVIGQLLFLLPSLSGIGQYKKITRFYNETISIRYFLTAFAKDKAVYFLTPHLPLEFPNISYTTAKHVSSFSSLFWMPGYVLQRINSVNKTEWLTLEKEKNYFVNKISEEIKVFKPYYIFVELVDTPHIKVLSILQSTASFRQAWEKYQYITLLNENTFWPIAVYQLKE